MIHKISALLISISIFVLLTACANEKTAVNSLSPTSSPLTEATTSPEPTASPQATPATIETPAPAATTPEASIPTATTSAKAKATPTVKPTSTATPTPSPEPTKAPKQTEAVNSEAAEALFKQSCTSCHGVDLGGDFGPNIQKVGGRLTKAQITNQITNGGDEMPPFKKSLKAEEIQVLAAWLAAKK